MAGESERRAAGGGSMLRHLTFAAVAVFVQWSGAECLSATVVQKVSIAQHPAIPLLSAADADRILDKMSAALRSSMPNCDVRFVRDGNPTTFQSDAAHWRITSEDEFNEFASVPGTLKVVGKIGWCSQPLPRIAGCSSLGGPIWLVTPDHGDLDPILWLHEYSHTTGNNHRTNANALMQPDLAISNVNVSGAECAKLLAGMQLGVNAPAAGLLRPVVDKQSKPLPIQNFIQELHAAGIPFDEASKYTDDDVPFLEGVLRDRSRAGQWGNAVWTLGGIGTLQAKYVLMNFLLSDPNGTLSAKEYEAKSDVPGALGWVIARSRENGHEADRNALDTLLGMTHDTWWKDTAKINWKTPIYPNQKELISSLIVEAVDAMRQCGMEACKSRLLQIVKAASGVPEAEAAAREDTGVAVERSLGAEARRASQEVSPETVAAVKAHKGFLSEVLKQQTVVQERGLRSFYESKQQK
jgi:hypothetical protein